MKYRVLALLLMALGGWVLGQTGSGPGTERVAPPRYPGGYLKFTYEGVGPGGTQLKTSMEISPLPDGRYEVRTTNYQVADATRVQPSFFGLGWVGLGFRVREAEQGGLDLTGVSALAQLTLTPGRTYLLPDGAMFQATEFGQIVGISVIYGIYTHGDAPNLRLELAWVLEGTVRDLLPFYPYARLVQRASPTGPFDTVLTEVRLTEFVRK